MHALKKACLYFLVVLLTASSVWAPAQAIIDPRFFSSNSILYYDDECLDESSATAVLLAGNDNTEKILNFFMQKGLNLAQAAGIVGNIMQESGLEPAIEQGGRIVDENYTPKNGVGFGLVQWTFTDRQAPLVAFTKEMGVSIIDLGGQLGFIWEELNGGYLTTLNGLRGTDDPVEAAVIFHDGYERSADTASEVRTVRGGNAQEIYDKYKDAPALAGAAASEEVRNPAGSLGATSEIPHEIPATTGKSAEEAAIDENGKFLSGNLSEHVAFADLASSASQEHRDYYITMRWGYTEWNWDGTSSGIVDQDYYDWLAEAPRIVEVTNPRTGKVINAAVLQSGPAPWTGVDRSSNNTPKQGWINPQTGTPEEYTGRVSGLAPEAYQYLEVEPGTYDGSGDELEYKWAPDQTVTPGPADGATGEKKSDVECTGTSFAGGNFNETLKHYAWSDYRGRTIEARPEYIEAFTTARSEGRYIGGIAHPGIDCGGFVTLLITDSGFDKGYNYEGRGGSTSTQEKWTRENWESLGPSSSIDPASLQPGDVALNNGHTFIYVGEVDGFESNIASASLDERAPMADTNQQATQSGFNWYRKK